MPNQLHTTVLKFLTQKPDGYHHGRIDISGYSDDQLLSALLEMRRLGSIRARFPPNQNNDAGIDFGEIQLTSASRRAF
jgi:hypothetical protein